MSVAAVEEARHLEWRGTGASHLGWRGRAFGIDNSQILGIIIASVDGIIVADSGQLTAGSYMLGLDSLKQIGRLEYHIDDTSGCEAPGHSYY